MLMAPYLPSGVPVSKTLMTRSQIRRWLSERAIVPVAVAVDGADPLSRTFPPPEGSAGGVCTIDETVRSSARTAVKRPSSVCFCSSGEWVLDMVCLLDRVGLLSARLAHR